MAGRLLVSAVVLLAAGNWASPAFAAGREPPAIVTQPTGQTVLPGALASFTVEVSSKTAPTYQWRFATADLLESSKYSGVTTPTLRISDVTPQDTGDYSVVVSNRGGAITSAVATLSLASATSCLPPPAGLIGWWPGDGSARDLVGTNHGTFEGGATADYNGMVGAAFNFDGTNKYIQIPDAPELNPQILSVECWVRFDNLDAPGTSVYPGQQYLVFKQNERSDNFEGYVLSKDRTFADVILWEVTSALGQLVRIDTTSTVTTNVWYHLAGTRGSNFIQLYFNGRLEAEASVDFPQNYGSLPLYFGTSGQAYWDRRLNGCLDEVALYNRVLTAAEIEALHASGPFGKCKGTNGIIITRQPENQSAAIGGTATFTVTASGIGPIAYQWQFDGATLPGATSSALNLTNVQLSDFGPYRVAISNLSGLVLSETVNLLSSQSPTVTIHPTNQIVAVGGTATFTVGGFPEPLGYQWFFSGSALPGASRPSLTLTNVQSAQAGPYLAVVTNSFGAATSSVAQLTVLLPPKIVAGPPDQVVVAGATVLLGVEASGSEPLGYQWFFQETNLQAQAAARTLGLTNVQPAQAGAYTVVVTNRVGAVTSAPARLTVLIAPVLVDARMAGNELFGFTLVGNPGTAYLIETSSNLTDWSEIGSVTNVTGQVQFFDTMPATNQQLYYRGRLEPPVKHLGQVQ